MRVAREVDADSVSLALREIMPETEPGREQLRFFEWLADSPQISQYILYDATDAECLIRLLDRQVVPNKHLSVLFVLGRSTSGQVADATSLIALLPYAGAFDTWFVVRSA